MHVASSEGMLSSFLSSTCSFLIPVASLGFTFTELTPSSFNTVVVIAVTVTAARFVRLPTGFWTLVASDISVLAFFAASSSFTIGGVVVVAEVFTVCNKIITTTHECNIHDIKMNINSYTVLYIINFNFNKFFLGYKYLHVHLLLIKY